MVRTWLERWSYPRLLLFALIAVIGLGLVVGASTSGAAFGTYTHSWEGTSELRSEADAAGAETIVAADTTRYEETPPEDTVGIILASEEAYGADDGARVADFVRRGGTVVIADDIGTTNQLLQEIGASTRIDGTPLRDERNYHRSPALPVATRTADHPYVAESESFTLNHGSALDPNGADVLIQSSEYSYLDQNRNEQFDGNEAIASHPVMTIEEVGDGQVIVISDTSALINVMLERPGNRAFVQQLFDAHDRVLIDQSHAGDLPPLALALLMLRESAVLQLLVIVGLVGGIALLDRRPERVQAIQRWLSGPTGAQSTESTLQPAELRAILETQHPEWDSDRRERVITVIMNKRKKGDTND
ncbi:DUF4350 domain-containing protein [Halalkalicoccus sp. GCM10025322]|uniref:DUF4350 domain-containing protein n=1 Tax=Halalkalicoccus TaxID=332246 RepID=UPI002F96D01F